MFTEECRCEVHENFDKLGEECGIFGGFVHKGDVKGIIRNGLFKLQHRGQESAGISCGEETQTLVKAKGLVMQALADSAILESNGRFGIGHVRYSTQGGSSAVNAQPYLIKYMDEHVAMAHNGNVKKAMKIREKFEKIGEVFITNSDSEVLLKRIVYGLRKPPSQWTFNEIGECLGEDFSKGAFSLALTLPKRIVAYRDPVGYRPLFVCEAKEGYFIASEDIAFTGLDIKKTIEVMPGEGVEITEKGYSIQRFYEQTKECKCVFEHIYFAHPASNIFGRNVYMTRVELGKTLAKTDNIKADIVVPVVDSGMAAAIGYSQESGIPFHTGLIRNHWVGRSFIAPTQESRINKVREKLLIVRPLIEGKKVLLVDDSMVRGTTSREIVSMLKNAGAKEVHFRLSSPMLLNTCSWGVDIPTTGELIAAVHKDEKKIAAAIGADSIKYLPMSALKEIFGETGWCYRCFEAEKEKPAKPLCKALAFAK
ncbi:MAG: amidophosphoribosyltransferase [Heliobacteriaceae bacterium]|jgi:amidophosphoribosyltransferase|nr:amidophosphoribosyltransferase [Heliobacteriaceae bacterium]